MFILFFSEQGTEGLTERSQRWKFAKALRLVWHLFWVFTFHLIRQVRTQLAKRPKRVIKGSLKGKDERRDASRHVYTIYACIYVNVTSNMADLTYSVHGKRNESSDCIHFTYNLYQGIYFPSFVLLIPFVYIKQWYRVFSQNNLHYQPLCIAT